MALAMAAREGAGKTKGRPVMKTPAREEREEGGGRRVIRKWQGCVCVKRCLFFVDPVAHAVEQGRRHLGAAR
jgi:hypothetical protein